MWDFELDIIKRDLGDVREALPTELNKTEVSNKVTHSDLICFYNLKDLYQVAVVEPFNAQQRELARIKEDHIPFYLSSPNGFYNYTPIINKQDENQPKLKTSHGPINGAKLVGAHYKVTVDLDQMKFLQKNLGREYDVQVYVPNSQD